MAHFRRFLLLLLAGLASALVLGRSPAAIDSLSSFAETGISARDGVHVAGKSWTPRVTPADEGKEYPSRASLAKRGFVSPYDVRKFVMATDSKVLPSAYWEFTTWVTNLNYNPMIWRGGRYVGGTSTSDNINEADIEIPLLVSVYASDTVFQGRADLVLSGFIGSAEVVVKFTAQFYSSADKMYVQQMTVMPTCTIAGASVTITSWTFDKS